MGLLKSAADLVYTIRFLKLLVTPFEDTGAFQAGIIDADGKKRSDYSMNTIDEREAYSTHYTPFHRLVYNVKKLMAKAPGGSSKLASYAAALYLIKESGNLSSKNLEKIHAETGIDILDMLSEQSEWFMLGDKQLAPGVYRIKNESITVNSLIEGIVLKNDQVRITEANSVACGEIFGICIYKGIHLKSNHEVYVSSAELTK